MNKNEERYQYTYSASQKNEVEKIRSKYVSKEPDKLDRLKQLDASTTRKGTQVSIASGTIGITLLGIGMYWTLDLLGTYFIPGIIIGIIGIIFIIIAYPLYNKVTKLERAKISDEIIRLSDELLNNK